MLLNKYPPPLERKLSHTIMICSKFDIPGTPNCSYRCGFAPRIEAFFVQKWAYSCRKRLFYSYFIGTCYRLDMNVLAPKS